MNENQSHSDIQTARGFALHAAHEVLCASTWALFAVETAPAIGWDVLISKARSMALIAGSIIRDIYLVEKRASATAYNEMVSGSLRRALIEAADNWRSYVNIVTAGGCNCVLLKKELDHLEELAEKAKAYGLEEELA